MAKKKSTGTANKRENLLKPMSAEIEAQPDALLADLRRLIEETRASVAIAVNSGLTLLYWQVGRRIQQDVLKHDRAEYGKEILATVSRQLVNLYGTGFSEKKHSAHDKICGNLPRGKDCLCTAETIELDAF